MTTLVPSGPFSLRAAAEFAVHQVARIASLDHDGEEFLRVGERDAVIGELQRRHHGQRPALFHQTACSSCPRTHPAPEPRLLKRAGELCRLTRPMTLDELGHGVDPTRR